VLAFDVVLGVHAADEDVFLLSFALTLRFVDVEKLIRFVEGPGWIHFSVSDLPGKRFTIVTIFDVVGFKIVKRFVVLQKSDIFLVLLLLLFGRSTIIFTEKIEFFLVGRIKSRANEESCSDSLLGPILWSVTCLFNPWLKVIAGVLQQILQILNLGQLTIDSIDTD